MTKLGFLITGTISMVYMVIVILAMISNSNGKKLNLMDALITAFTTINVIFILNALKYIVF